MRRSLTLLVRATAVPVAAVLLTACGGGDGDSDSAASSSAAESSSAAPSSSEAAEGDSEFCSQAENFGTELSSSFSSDDPAQLTQNLQDAADGLREIEAPDEISEDWNALADGLDQVATTLDGVDPNDPEAAAEVQQQLAGLQESATNVQTYLQEECGIDAGGAAGSSSAAPSS